MSRSVALFLAVFVSLAASAGFQPTPSFLNIIDYSFTHFAGTTGGGAYQDGIGSAARFTSPRAIAVDRNGNIYVGEQATLRRISSTGNVTTFAGKWRQPGTISLQGGSARLNGVQGIAIDSAGNIFIAEYNGCVIRRITPAGFVNDFVGSAGSCSTVDGIGTGARLYYPQGLAIDSADNLYFSQNDNVIRKVTNGGLVTTLAGMAGVSGSNDGTGSAARFYYPQGLAIDSAGNVFVADALNYTIRRITPLGAVTTFAGTAGVSGSLDGTGASARFYLPYGLTIDAADMLYEVDGTNLLRRVTPGGVVTTIAGAANVAGSVDGTGANARFSFPYAVATDRGGNLFVADTGNNTIRKVSAANVVTTFAGLAVEKGVVDATGSAARFKYPRDVTTDSSGNVYVTDQQSQSIRKITPAGVVTTFAGSGVAGGADGIGTAATFSDPIGITSDSAGNLYVADSAGKTIRKISPGGVVTTLAGSFGVVGVVDGTGSAARFNFPQNLTVDASGNVYVTEYFQHVIRKITPAGVVTTLAGQNGVCGFTDGTGAGASFCNPRGIVVGEGGDLFVADSSKYTIRRVTPAGLVTTYAGSAGNYANTDGTGSAARFESPLAVAYDSVNAFLFVTQGDDSIRKIFPGAQVTTIATGSCCESVDGTVSIRAGSPLARIFNPEGITVASSGTIYIAGRDDAAIYVARTAIDDAATASAFPNVVGVATQLHTSPATATSWTWSVLRRPTGSVATLSSTSIRNPTFTSDIPDLYTFLLKAESASGVRYSMVDVAPTGGCTNPLTAVTAAINGSTMFCTNASGGTASVTSTTGGLELSYRWGWRSTSGGTVTDIPGANSPTYAIRGSDLGGSGTRYVVVTVVPACGTTRVSNELTVNVLPAPNATITAPSSVQGLSTGNAASVPDTPGATYAWSVNNGTITSGLGTRSITYTAGNDSPITIGVTVTAGGCASIGTASVTVVPAPYTFEHLAGSTGGAGTADGTGTTARFFGIRAIAIDPNGTLYVADTNNHVIRTISRDGKVRTLAGMSGTTCGNVDGTGSAARLCSPTALAVDASGKVFVACNGAIKKITAAGVVTTFAGAFGNYGSTDATGSAARFSSTIYGLAVDAAGNVLVADSNNYTIRKITPAGVVSTLAGTAGVSGSTDGTGTAARFYFPAQIAIDASGILYVSEYYNFTIRTVTGAGVVATLAGSAGSYGYVDGPATSARFAYPDGIAVDRNGTVYVGDTYNYRIRAIRSGMVSTFAGGGQYPTVDAVGTAARFDTPAGVACDRNGDLYVTDGGVAVRKITPAGVVTTFVGEVIRPGSADGTASAALFNYPYGVARDAAGNIFVTDTYNQTIRRITPAGVTSTFAGLAGNSGGDDGTGSAARFFYPVGIAVDSAGNLYVANTSGNTIRKITPAGVVTTLAGQHGANGSVDGTGSAARFYAPRGVAVDSSGNVYVADTYNHTIRQITSAGVVTTLAGQAGTAGLIDGTGSAARFSYPQTLVVESTGNILVGDTNNQRIRRVTPAGVVTTLTPVNSLGAPVGNLRAVGMAIDASDSLYIDDGTQQNLVKKMTAAGVVTTIGNTLLGGTNTVWGSTDGSGSMARFTEPEGIAVDSTGETLYIADFYNTDIRIGRLTRTLDVATVNLSSVAAGTSVQLDTAPQSATSWSWSIIRQPAGSSAVLSSTSIRNPTFTPDMPDLYTFLLRADGPGGVRYSTVDLTATGTCTPALTGAVASMSGSTTFCATATGGTASVAVTGGALTSYRWGWRATSGGAITDIGGATGASYTARGADMGGTGARFLVVTVTPGCGSPMVSNEIPVTVTAAPNVTITAPVAVTARTGGYSASVPDAGSGSTYAWSISLGQITSGASTHQITFAANNESPITLSVVVTTGGGSCPNSSSTTVPVSTYPYTWKLFAGTAGGSGNSDGAPNAARFYNLNAIAMDRNGNAYFADLTNIIRKVSPSGQVSTLAGLAFSDCALVDGVGYAARFCRPERLVVDPGGNVFVADGANYAIRKITPDGVVTTIAGGTYGSADGTGSAAQFNFPVGITIDPSGTLFVTDFSNGTIRQVTQAGVVTTIAGLAGSSGTTDGTGSAARFLGPAFITSDGAGSLYVADTLNHRIRKVTVPGAVVTTVAGSAQGYADGTGAAARFNFPEAVVVDLSGDLIVADSGNAVIRKVTTAGVVTTIAGTPGVAGYLDGPANTAKFNRPKGLAVDAAGRILVAEYSNYDIRRITNGNVSTFTGAGALAGSADGTGSAASFNQPFGVGDDPLTGNLFIADTFNNTIRKATPGAVVTTFAGTPSSTPGSADGTGPAASFYTPRQTAVDGAGNVYVSDWQNDTIRKITPAGVVTTIAGIPGVAGFSDGGPGVSTLNWPVGITVDPGGTVYFTDFNNAVVRKVTLAGIVSTIAGMPRAAGYADGNGSAARFNGPHGITIDTAGNLYVADAYNHRIRKITPTHDVTTVAGTSQGLVDGTRFVAQFNTPTGVTVDSSGLLYVADRYNHRIRKVTPDGTVSTIGGQVLDGNMEGTGTIAMLGQPSEITVDTNGALYIADIANNNIRVGRVITLPDSAIASSTNVPVGTTVQLDASAQTAGASYSWSFLRQPGASGAQLSSPSVRNPTFVPDIADLYTFLLKAEGPGGTRYSLIDITATGSCTPLSAAANASVSGATSVCATGSGGTASVATTGGAGLSYRWGYRNVSGGSITDIPLANASTYSIQGADFGAPGTKFLVVTVTPTCGSPTTSNETTITIRPPLAGVSIAASGSTIVSPTGTAGTATLTYSGGAPVTQQWGYRTTSGGAITNISGQTGMTYVINGNHFPGMGTYYLVATATPGCGNVTTSNEITVNVGFTIATSVVAASNAAGTSIHITWVAAVGATTYDVMKRSAPGSFTLIGTTSSTSFDDSSSVPNSSVTPDSAYLYRITVTGGGDSANTYAGTFIFTDAPLTSATGIKGAHFMELRSAANKMRALAGLTAAVFTDATLSSSITIKRIHLIEIRNAVADARTTLIVPAINFGETVIDAGVTTVKVSHLEELQRGVR